MIVAIHQPHYLPWLRYVDKIARCDVFVLLDDAQYSKNGWQNRNKIKCATGWMYLTVPVLNASAKPIHEVRIGNQPGGPKNQRWRAKHWGALRTNYAKAPFFARYLQMFETTYSSEWERLHDLTVHMLRLLLDALDIRTPLVPSSQLGVPGQGTTRLVDICLKLGATTYLSGDYAVGNHLDTTLFTERGIEVQLQGWHCPEYRQQYMQAGFIPDLSIVDLLFNEGERAFAVLTRSQSRFSLPAG